MTKRYTVSVLMLSALLVLAMTGLATAQEDPSKLVVSLRVVGDEQVIGSGLEIGIVSDHVFGYDEVSGQWAAKMLQRTSKTPTDSRYFFLDIDNDLLYDETGYYNAVIRIHVLGKVPGEFRVQYDSTESTERKATPTVGSASYETIEAHQVNQWLVFEYAAPDMRFRDRAAGGGNRTDFRIHGRNGFELHVGYVEVIVDLNSRHEL